MMERLTEREKKILLLMCEGVSKDKIAKIIGVHPSTISVAWNRIQTKTGYEFIGHLALIVKDEVRRLINARQTDRA